MGQVFFNEVQGNFNLRQPKANKPTNIYLVVRVAGRQVKLSTGVRVYPEQWNKEKQEAYVSVRLSELDNRNNEIANKKINDMKVCFLEYKKYLCENPNLIDDSISILREKLYKGNNKRMAKKQDILATLQMLKLVEEQDKEESTKNLKCNLIKQFAEFLKESSIKDSWDNMNLETFNTYKNKLIEKRLAPNTINTKFKYLKSVLHVASKRNDIPFDWNKSNLDSFDFVKDKTNTTKRKQKQVVFTEEQIKQLYLFKPENKLIEEIKDVFVLQCLVGQRISDMSKFFNGGYTINDNNTITIIQKKKNEMATIPLFDEAKEILSKYKNGLENPYILKESYNGRLNDTIRNICKELNFDEKIEYEKQRGLERMIKTDPFYKLVHTHTARHTFITIMCLNNVPKDITIIATGHKDTKMIDEVYEHLSHAQKANKIKTVVSKTIGSSLFNSSTKKVNEENNSLYDFGKAFAKQEEEHKIGKECISISNDMKQFLYELGDKQDMFRQLVKKGLSYKDISDILNIPYELDDKGNISFSYKKDKNLSSEHIISIESNMIDNIFDE